ncbi:MAG: DUF1924 domain-containing protein [Sulfurimonas sp.]|nr:DUF1924 domain-containing protein [Sulfurimonas sp.]
MKKLLISLTLLISIAEAYDFNPQMQKYMNDLKTEAKKANPEFKGFDYSRGEKIFTSKHVGKRGKLISCVTCHTSDFSKNGENISTGKVIDPLSPTTNADRFVKVKDVKKWLRRNFKDVYVREGSAQEKGDVVIYIVNKK